MDTTPQMFRPDSFPAFLTFEEGPDSFSMPTNIAGRTMDTPVSIFNQSFRKAVGGWGLPAPQIEEGSDGDVGQSEAEITAAVYVKPRGALHQFEFFFTRQPEFTQRSNYGAVNKVPYTAMTLHEMRAELNGSLNGLSLAEIVEKFNPMGFIFAHVEDRLKNQSGIDVAYTCGGLCDVLNVWHVALVPGVKLFLALVDGGRTGDGQSRTRALVPYAGLMHPAEDPAFLKLVGEENWAVIEIGTVCVNSNQPPIMPDGRRYVMDLQTRLPVWGTHTLADTTDPTLVKHNILRVNVQMLYWMYYQGAAGGGFGGGGDGFGEEDGEVREVRDRGDSPRTSEIDNAAGYDPDDIDDNNADEEDDYVFQ